MLAAPEVAVVVTDLARTDRRALSEAWYSALHLAGRGGGGGVPGARTRGGAAGDAPRSPVLGERQARRSVRCANPGASDSATPRRTTARARPRHGTVRDVAAERRSLAPRFARRIARDVVRSVAREGAASFTVRDACARVRVFVRVDGVRVRVVALCSPALRERVERALAHARFACASRGLEIGGSL